MSCPPVIAAILLEILTTGILRIRARTWSGVVEGIADEVDQIHNLADLLEDFSQPRLEYHWDVERTAFFAHVARNPLARLEPLWRELGPFVEATREPLSLGTLDDRTCLLRT